MACRAKSTSPSRTAGPLVRLFLSPLYTLPQVSKRLPPLPPPGASTFRRTRVNRPLSLRQPGTRAGHATVVLDDAVVIALHPRLDQVGVVPLRHPAELV